MAREVSSERRSCTSWVMNWRPSRCLRARLAMETMKAAPSGCCMMRPDLVDDEQAGLRVLRGGGPDGLGADHGRSGAQFGFEETEVEDGDERLVGEQVVSLVGEQVAEAAGCEGS